MALNRRCKHLKYKLLRRFGVDLWGRLAIKRRNNRITKLIASLARSACSRQMRMLKYTKKRRRRLWKKLTATTDARKKRSKLKETRLPKIHFLFSLNDKPPLKRPRRSGYRGLLLKQRKMINLFVTAGKVRQKAWRRYAKVSSGFIRNVNKKIKKRMYSGVIESRLDILLVRANFVDSIFKARHLILNGHATVDLVPRRIIEPAYALVVYQPFALENRLMKITREVLRRRLRRNRIINFPSYLFINFSTMVVYKIEDPRGYQIKYPFGGSLGGFENSFRCL